MRKLIMGYAKSKKGTPLTAELLKEIRIYDPLTGVFYINSKYKSVCGCINKVNGYIQLNINHRTYLAHRLAFLYMTGAWPEQEVDHINRIRNDNRWENLRDIDKGTNQRNSTNSTTSNIYHVTKNSFAVRMHVHGEYIQIGSAHTYEGAKVLRDRARKKYFPEEYKEVEK